MKIDNDFKNLLPELTAEEYTGLERDIVKHGILSPIILWNDTIVDGHNRYAIAQAHRMPDSVIPTKEIKFSSRDEAIAWILRHQLGRRNLTDFQRNEIALKHEEVIARQMKERMSDGGKGGSGDHPLSNEDKTTKRKELAKIAGTSEASIQRTKLILDQGTPEQIERVRKGEKSIGGMVNEIKKKRAYTPEQIIKRNELRRKQYDREKNHSQYEEEFRAQHNERTFKYLQMELKSVVEASVNNILDTIKDYESREILIDEESANSIHEILSALSKVIESVKERKND